jgi:uncharacterized membrane protein (UPF0127 family)
MKLYNLSRQQIISPKVVKAQTLFERSIGLIGKTKITTLYLKTRWGIHTVGVKLPLTIIVCDSSFVVKAVKRNLLPNRLFFWNPKWLNVFELPAGKYQVTIGDKLKLQEC